MTTAADLMLVETASDHDAVIAERVNRRGRLSDVVAEANVKATLSLDQAEAAIRKVIETAGRRFGGLDAIVLLETYRRRMRMLRRLEGEYPLRFHKAPGGAPIGIDPDRFEHVRTRPVLLAGLGRVDKSPGRRVILGPNVSTLVIVRERATGDEWAFLSYHLTAEVEHDARDRNGDGYRDDRPKRVRRHKLERRRLNRVARRQLRKGRKVRAAGDSNLDLMPIAGLRSAWEGRRNQPRGTHGGRRKIDDVQAGEPR